jgi:hypothetical protein
VFVASSQGTLHEFVVRVMETSVEAVFSGLTNPCEKLRSTFFQGLFQRKKGFVTFFKVVIREWCHTALQK